MKKKSEPYKPYNVQNTNIKQKSDQKRFYQVKHSKQAKETQTVEVRVGQTINYVAHRIVKFRYINVYISTF